MTRKYYFLSIIMLMSTVKCIPNRYYSNKNSRHTRDIFGPSQKFISSSAGTLLLNETTNGKKIITTTETNTEKSIKKWQVGRVSRKQYEIVNMLWRKTKIFADVEPITMTPMFKKNGTVNKTNKYLKKSFTFPLVRPHLQPSTESYIEFYYLEENDDIEHKDKKFNVTKYASRLSSENHIYLRPLLSLSPFLVFHVNGPNHRRTATPTLHFQATSSKREYPHIHNLPFLSQKLNKRALNLQKPSSIKYNSNLIAKLRQYFLENDISDEAKHETCPMTTQDITENMTSSADKITTKIYNYVTTATTDNKYTTFYDKIKFFEMYDRNTKDSRNAIDEDDLNSIDNLSDSAYSNNTKILLKHVDEKTDHNDGSHKNKFVKKHIAQNELREIIKDQSNKNIELALPNEIKRIKLFEKTNDISNNYLSAHNYLYKKCNGTLACQIFFNLSKPALWSQYPFAAVYVYEPSQVYCDAAGISPHWLVTAASCLSRHRLDKPGIEEYRSAFVTYCGGYWKKPDRIAYVKYSLVHPGYHPKDKYRRYLYNIGVIQVTSPMNSACSRWSPLPLMSHQYTTNNDGSTASAVGWGLDRYDSSYVSTALPKWPLMVYEGLIYSDSCPGHTGYHKMKRSSEARLAIRNIFCLSLPPYAGEAQDPVHGSLLLVGGKLIALYLQEERRPWGEQSAQYTSIWRLIPWVLNVAREPEDIDAFTEDI